MPTSKLPIRVNSLLILSVLLSTLSFGQTISLSSVVGPPTGKTMASGSGFSPSVTIDLLFDSTALAVANADAGGAFSNVSLTVPASALPGNHVIAAVPRDGGTSAQVTFLVRTDWNQHQFSSDRAGTNPYENLLSVDSVKGLQVKWVFDLGGRVGTQATIAGGVAYFDGWDNYIHAVNALSGVELWRYSTNCNLTSPPAIAGGIVYAGTTYCDFIALDTATGNKLWSYPRSMVGGPTVVDGVVYTASGNYGDSYASALDAKTGTELWSTYTGADTLTSPAVADGMVYIGDQRGAHALDAATGAIVWDYPAGDLYAYTVAVANHVIYAGSPDGKLYALNAKTGAKLWSFSTAGAISIALAVNDGVVYFGSDDHNLYALDAGSGATLWTANIDAGQFSDPAIANGIVFAGTSDTKLFALDAKTGVTLWNYDIGRPKVVGVSVSDGMVFATSQEPNPQPDQVYAFYLPVVLSFSSNRLSFNTQLVGTTSSPQTVTVTSTGSLPVTISGIAASPQFQQTNDCPATLDVGKSCTISVTFAPTSGGVKNGTITISSNASGGQQTVALTGSATAVRLSVPGMDFHDQVVGTSSPPRSVRITNVGTAPVRFTGLGVNGKNFSDFTYSTSCGSALAGGSSCAVSLTFTPKGQGARQATLAISDNGGASPQLVILRGNGI